MQQRCWINSAKASQASSPPTPSFGLGPPAPSPSSSSAADSSLPAPGWQLDCPVILPSAQRWEERADWLTPGAVRSNPQLQATNWGFVSFSLLLSLYITLYTPQTFFCSQHSGFRLMLSFCLAVTFCCYRFIFSVCCLTFSPYCCRGGRRDRVVTSSSLKCTNFCPCTVWWEYRPGSAWSLYSHLGENNFVVVVKFYERRWWSEFNKFEAVESTASSIFIFGMVIHLICSFLLWN